jgi:hypothetical protein
MSRACLAVILATAALLGLTTAVAASPPDPANSYAPPLITIVGLGPDGSADPLGTFTVVVRDFNNVPMRNVDVVLDFSRCPDIRLCADPHDPSVTVDCIAHTLMKLSDANGQATFRVVGFAANQGGSPGSIGTSLDVFADGVFINAVRVAALDQNGGGVNGVDLSLFLADYFSGQAFARSDFDGNGTIDGNDLSLWLAAFFAGGSTISGGTACP